MLQSGLGLGSLASEVSLPIFVHHTWIWDRLFRCCATPCLLASPPFLPVWMNVASLNPCVKTSIQFDFDSSGCYLFWGLVAILSVVVQGGKVYLLTPPFWPEVLRLLLNTLFFFYCYFFFSFKYFTYLFLDREEGGETERERNINVWLPLVCQLETWPTTQACALTGYRTATLGSQSVFQSTEP